MSNDPAHEPERWLVVVGGSAGSMDPLITLFSTLPHDLPASVLVVLHMHPRSGTMLPQILSRNSSWPVAPAVDGESVELGQAYTAVPDHHLLVEPGPRFRVVTGPKESGHRPGVDPLFRSASNVSARTIAVVLSGGLDDGSAGAAAVRRAGGFVVVQDPDEAATPDMPRHAIRTVQPDAVLPSEQIAAWIAERIRSTAAVAPPARAADANVGEVDLPLPEQSQFVCPDCGGGMRVVDDPHSVRFRCHVGHGWTASALRARQDESLDEALWTALRTIEDQIALDQRLFERASEAGRAEAVRLIAARLHQQQESSRALWHLLTGGPAGPIRTAAQPLVDDSISGDVRPPRNGATARRRGAAPDPSDPRSGVGTA